MRKPTLFVKAVFIAVGIGLLAWQGAVFGQGKNVKARSRVTTKYKDCPRFAYALKVGDEYLAYFRFPNSRGKHLPMSAGEIERALYMARARGGKLKSGEKESLAELKKAKQALQEYIADRIGPKTVPQPLALDGPK